MRNNFKIIKIVKLACFIYTSREDHLSVATASKLLLSCIMDVVENKNACVGIMQLSNESGPRQQHLGSINDNNMERQEKQPAAAAAEAAAAADVATAAAVVAAAAAAEATVTANSGATRCDSTNESMEIWKKIIFALEKWILRKHF
ncbi:unnamed protein product [Meganyctiphanes norvegica]|uniref:Uncharacterized protein n=1 Tax=Meganyctiphanes norvegica TaxID=48144 RepID=A0AAV2PFS2_MEGNR